MTKTSPTFPQFSIKTTLLEKIQYTNKSQFGTKYRGDSIGDGLVSFKDLVTRMLLRFLECIWTRSTILLILYDKKTSPGVPPIKLIFPLYAW